MVSHCIVCGVKGDVNFLYRVKDMSVSMCARHVSDYVDRELNIHYINSKKPTSPFKQGIVSS